MMPVEQKPLPVPTGEVFGGKPKLEYACASHHICLDICATRTTIGTESFRTAFRPCTEAYGAVILFFHRQTYCASKRLYHHCLIVPQASRRGVLGSMVALELLT